MRSRAASISAMVCSRVALRLIATGSGFEATVSARASSRPWRQSWRWDSSRTRKGSHAIAGAGEGVVLVLVLVLVVVLSVGMGVLLEWATTRTRRRRDARRGLARGTRRVR